MGHNVFVFIVKSPEETELPLLLFFSLGGHLPLSYFPGSSKNPLTIIYILTLIHPHTLPGIFILKLYL